ncbi:hypothetical protein LTR84_000152 [Exophiala bonariae]|uniref:Zn(2)-C6 fungal-type domain-containing protein n=1 Tax=Exophiala bonariae TaxID=1690606 RepID=A0AAV9NPQ4_9EURO|nr:hypothetical protein LTR84_000152 [Exophiala bonariae]
MASSELSDGHRRNAHHVLPSQRRAGRACLSCRAKKVKCDVLQHGIPCKNCLNSNFECLTVRCRRGKKPSTKTKNSPRPLWEEVPVEKFFETRETSTRTESNVKLPEAARPSRPSSFNLHNDAASLLDPLFSLGDIPTGLERIRSSVTARIPKSDDAAPKEFPAVFKPFPNHWSPLDLEYLHRKGALSMPQARLRLEIIRCYAEYLHPYMPLLDLDELLQMVDLSMNDGSRPRYSFLLFQCVMFAGISFVDEQLVQESEHKSIKAARRLFYEKARLLYDADIETDNLTLIQCLLLMSQWAANADTNKQNWHWTGVAVSLAQAMRLTHNPEILELPQRVKSLRKRLWFCILMRDRLLSLGMSRPMRIRDGEFDVPLPTVDDFECDIPIVTSVAGHHRDGKIQISLTEADISTKLATMFILYIKLCMSIGSIFSVQYTTFMKTSEGPIEASNSISAKIMLYPISNQSSDRTFVQIRDSNFSLLEKSLTEWLGSLPCFSHLSEMLSRVARDPISIDNPPKEQDFCVEPIASREPFSVALQVAILHLTYFAASSALHRPKNRSLISSQKVAEAAEGMAMICAFLNKNGLTRYLPVNTITMLLPSIIWYINYLRRVVMTDPSGQHSTTEETEIHRARDSLSELLVSLHILRKAHVGADFVTLLLQAYLVRSGARVVPSAAATDLKHSTLRARREFELELNCHQTPSRDRVNVKNTPVFDGPLTPQSQGVQVPPASGFNSNELIELPMSENNTLRPDLLFEFSYGADLDSDGTGEETTNMVFGFPDSGVYWGIDMGDMNSSPNMALWEESVSNCNDLGFNLDWLA